MIRQLKSRSEGLKALSELNVPEDSVFKLKVKFYFPQIVSEEGHE